MKFVIATFFMSFLFLMFVQCVFMFCDVAVQFSSCTFFASLQRYLSFLSHAFVFEFVVLDFVGLFSVCVSSSFVLVVYEALCGGASFLAAPQNEFPRKQNSYTQHVFPHASPLNLKKKGQRQAPERRKRRKNDSEEH